MRDMETILGTLFDGRYRIIEFLGGGTSAKVYRALDTKTSEDVAVKIFDEERLRDPEAKRQFDHEVKAFALLDTHPNIVSYLGGSMREGNRYIVMELAVGETLSHYMNHKGGKLSLDESLNYFSQILSALAHSHAKGVIHRDVKPQNVRLVNGNLIKLCDFGIALIPEVDPIDSSKAVGTVFYISPEQATGGRVDARSDIYSAGILFYELLTGHLPFTSDKSNSFDRMDDIIRKHLKEAPANPVVFDPNIPTPIAQIILRAINKNPSKRFSSAKEMLTFIKLYKEDPTIHFNFDIPDDPFDAYDALPKETDAKQFLSDLVTKVADVDVGADQDKRTAQEPRSKKNNLVLLSVFLSLLVTFVGVLFILADRVFFYDTEDRTVITVGDLLNRPFDDALEKELTEKGYELKLEYRYDPVQPLNTILAQDPPAREAQKLSPGENPRLTLTLSGGCRVMIMPDYVGKDYRSCEIELTSQGFAVQVVKQFSSSPDGTVIATEPSVGEAAIQNEAVVFYVSKGEETQYSYMPSLVGLSADEAISSLEKTGIALDGILYEESTAPAGEVIKQSRPQGEKVAIQYSTVTITVSKGTILDFLPQE